MKVSSFLLLFSVGFLGEFTAALLPKAATRVEAKPAVVCEVKRHFPPGVWYDTLIHALSARISAHESQRMNLSA